MANTEALAKVLQSLRAISLSVVKNNTRQLSSMSSRVSIGSGEVVPETCGRGDKRTKKGKRFKGTFGNCRPRRDKRIARFKEKIEAPPNTPWPLPFKVI